jgi:glycosyltransferase involved in cell wall biosynthesis
VQRPSHFDREADTNQSGSGCSAGGRRTGRSPAVRIHFLLTKNILAGGGIETYTREVGRRLVSRGHEVIVYSTGGTRGVPQRLDGMRIVWLPRTRPHWTEKFSGAVMAAAREMLAKRPDILHLHSTAAGAMSALLRIRPAPCVVQMHGIEWARSRWGRPARMVLRGLEQCTLTFGHAFTAVSKSQCDYFASQYGAHCEFIPTAAEVKEPVPADLITKLELQTRQYLLFAARLVPEKGAHLLIRAYRPLACQMPLVIAGDCPSRDYGQELKRLAGDDPRIRFLGHVRGRLLEELFSNAGIFIQPSELEGMSIGLLEAMSYGLPCVASDIPENMEVIGAAGLPFQNKNHEDLARVLNRAIHNPTAAAAIGSEARRRVKRKFSWDCVVDQLEQLYERVAGGVQARRLAAYSAAAGGAANSAD